MVFLCLSIAAQDFKTIKDGIEYAEVTRGTKNEPVHINLLRLDLTKVRLDVVHAMDAAIGLEKISSMSARHKAFAAINAGFFRLDKSIFAGDAAGVLMIDGKLLSESYGGRSTLKISNERKKTITEISKINVVPSLMINNQDINISGINRQIKEDEVVLFTPEFSRTTLTVEKCLEIIIEEGKIVRISEASGNNSIPQRGLVLSATGKRVKELIGQIKVGDKVLTGVQLFPVKSESTGEISKFSSTAIEDLVGGVPQLIKNGKIEITWEQEKTNKLFVETRHPRTAVAKLKDGKFLMVTVDGRQEGWSVGMNLNELAAFLLELGATDAMNLDGGGSTTMFLDGKVVNKPSDKEGERSVSDAILVFPRK